MRKYTGKLHILYGINIQNIKITPTIQQLYKQQQQQQAAQFKVGERPSFLQRRYTNGG